MRSEDTLDTRILSNGKIIVSARGTVISYQRPSFNVMLIELTGQEDASLSQLFFDLLERELAFDQRKWPRNNARARVELFVDARHVTRHGLMFEAWIRFLLQRRQHLRRIHILAVNKVSQLSVEIIRHLSDTGSLIKLYDSPSEFQSTMRVIERPSGPPRHVRSTIERLNGYLDMIRLANAARRQRD